MNNLSKQEAEKRLASIETEVQQLRKIIEAPEIKSDKPAIERITSFEIACKELKIKTHKDAYRVLRMKNRKLLGGIPISKCDDAGLKLMIVIRALNEGWWPDWDDSNQKKWWNWFWMNRKNGFVFGDTTYGNVASTVGSRMCFHSEQLARSAATQKWIVSLYEEYMT